MLGVRRPDGDLGPGDYERYAAGIRGRVRDRDARPQEERRGRTARPQARTEIRQSLSLIGMTALTLLASIGLGILAGHIG